MKTFAAASSLALIATLLTACPPGDGGGEGEGEGEQSEGEGEGEGASAVFDPIVDAIDARLLACGDDARGAVLDRVNDDTPPPANPWRAFALNDLAASGFTLDADRTQDCLAALEVVECRALAALLAHDCFLGAVAGTRAQGEGCTAFPSQPGIASSCAPGLLCDTEEFCGVCVDAPDVGDACDGDCASGAVCVDGTCVDVDIAVIGDVGVACAEESTAVQRVCEGTYAGLRCADDATCQPVDVVANGGACDVDADVCASAFDVCANGANGGDDFACVEAGDVGQPCVGSEVCEQQGSATVCFSFEHCRAGLFCDDDGACSALPALGENCDAQECAGGINCYTQDDGSGECGVTRALGERCGQDDVDDCGFGTTCHPRLQVCLAVRHPQRCAR